MTEEIKDLPKWTAGTLEEAIYKITLDTDLATFKMRGEGDCNKILPYVTRDSVVLDLGCGIGRVMLPLASHVKEVHGVDISPDMVRFGREYLKGIGNVYLYPVNGVDFRGFTTGKFDFVYSFITLQHIMSKRALVNNLFEIKRILKYGGKAYITFLDLKENWYNFLTASPTTENTCMHTWEEIMWLLKTVGLRVLGEHHLFGNIELVIQKKYDALIYYYFWYEESMNDWNKISKELEDIKGLGLDGIVIDIEPSLLTSYSNPASPGLSTGNPRIKNSYIKTYQFILSECERLQLSVLPILAFGAGMLSNDFFQSNPDCVAKDEGGNDVPFVLGPDGKTIITPWMTYYNAKVISYLENHFRHILNIHKDSRAAYRVDGRMVVEILEDVGYPKQLNTDYCESAKIGMGVGLDKKHAIEKFLEELVNWCHEKYDCYCLYHAYRDGRIMHSGQVMENMGLDYELFSSVCDGQMDTVAPFNCDYEYYRSGYNYMAKCNHGKLVFPVISCNDERFDILPQIEALNGFGPTAIVFYPYNDYPHQGVNIKNIEKFRAQIKHTIGGA